MSFHAALGNDLIDVFAGGHLDPGAMEYFNQRSQELQQSVSGQAAQFFHQARNLYQIISATDATQILRNLQSKAEGLWDHNTIHLMTNLSQLQTANPIMQRWIMAQPDLRQMYLNNEVDGYADSYVNYHGDTVGRLHYDYRQVVEGMVMPTADGYTVSHFIEERPEEDTPLTLHQKADVLRTWQLVKHYLDEADEDPTSPTGNKL